MERAVSSPVTNDNSFILEPTRYILSVNVNIYNVIKLAREEWKYKWYENKTLAHSYFLSFVAIAIQGCSKIYRESQNSCRLINNEQKQYELQL